MIHDRAIDHPRVSRRVPAGRRTANFVLLTGAADVDDQVRTWLVESYDATA